MDETNTLKIPNSLNPRIMIKSNYIKILLTFLIFLGLGFFISNILEMTLLNVAMFVFGLFLAFALDNRKKRLEIIKDKLRLQDAKLLNVYTLSKQFDEETRIEVQK